MFNDNAGFTLLSLCAHRHNGYHWTRLSLKIKVVRFCLDKCVYDRA